MPFFLYFRFSGTLFPVSMIDGDYGSNMNDLWYVVTEIYFNQNFVVPLKGVLDFDLQPHPGAGTLWSEVMV